MSEDSATESAPPTDGGTARHDRVTSHPTPGPGNSLAGWPAHRSPIRVAINYAVVWIVRISPSLAVKRWLLRRLGATIGEGVALGLEATPDVFWPDHITVGDDAILGYDSTILCHEFLQDEYRVGEVHVGERAMIGAGAVVLPGVRIGADASVAANSLVTDDVPPGETVGGIPARPMSADAIRDGRHDGPSGTRSETVASTESVDDTGSEAGGPAREDVDDGGGTVTESPGDPLDPGGSSS